MSGSTAHAGDRAAVRLRVVLGVMCAFLLLLVGKLWSLQVSESSHYADRSYQQTIRRVRMPGYRGRIFDRHGKTLAENRPSYCVALYIEEFRQPGKRANTVAELERVLDVLATVVGTPSHITTDQIKAHIVRRLPLPLLAWTDIDRAAMSRIAEQQNAFPGVEIFVDPVRTYPQGDLLAHVLGYVRKVGPRTEDGKPVTDFDFYIPEMEGTRGIERSLNNVLLGKAGGRIIRVDATGYTRRLTLDQATMHERRPEIGGDVYLSVDVKMQRMLEDLLAGRPGAGVILNPRNGDVLAVASAPTFDPNAFVPAISAQRWEAIRSDPGKPLHNRAVSGLYPPGSTFKPVVLVAALENGLATPATVYNCPGYYALGTTARLNCWISRYNRSHGDIGMIKSVEQSCNTYFCELAVHIGYDPLYHTAVAMGLGHRSNVGIDSEQRGVMPAPGTIRSRGDIANVSIGQGAVAVTPIQMAVVAATLANGGKVFRPRLVLRETQRGSEDVVFRTPHLVRDLGWSTMTSETVRKGMYDVVMSDSGTGKRARVDGLAFGGKTGTAEYGPRNARKKRGWMIAFAPFSQPEYAVAIVLDDAVSGGVDVGPIMKDLLTGLFFPDRLVELPPRGEAAQG